MRTIGVIQPSFLPWRGYFALLAQCDAFVLYDDVQFDKNGWRNRNRIKTNAGAQWITVPVITAGRSTQKINETRINYDLPWARKILGRIHANYVRAPYFKEYFPWLEAELQKNWDTISDLNVSLTRDICRFLDLHVELHLSSELRCPDDMGRIENLVWICRRLEGDVYLSGPTGRDYFGDTPAFRNAGVELQYMSYDLPPYPQLDAQFEPQASVIDLLFNCGPESRAYLAPTSAQRRLPQLNLAALMSMGGAHASRPEAMPSQSNSFSPTQR